MQYIYHNSIQHNIQIQYCFKIWFYDHTLINANRSAKASENAYVILVLQDI